MSDSKNTETAAIMAFFAGAALAAGAALLLTPKPGREVREKLGEVTEDAVGKIRTAVREAKYKVAPKGKDESGDIEGGGCWI
ncbi:YtxH domain-containing protein [Geobacter benzoatilyticus]|jgi:gas vesicle protein|uniref:YtxH domain-containing protein n=1 Tax=Geobacter benzoatilyticus TaxID=2815309 RepID=A0ABX7Q8B6_9BACT|nr:YtxH domain-containing protein [Geobacter benzoatilyticus]QSV47220.1 YtxH domain-containing protein [Geobacter benzoatilyticus]